MVTSLISPAWSQAKYNPFRVLIPYGKAITIHGLNRHTGIPVNANGLTYEAEKLRVNVLAQFPDTPTKNNFGVDRLMGHKKGAPVSKHAKGEALDWMIAKYNKLVGIQVEDTAHGQAIFDWLVSLAKDQPLRWQDGRAYRGEARIGQVIYNGMIYQASQNIVRRLSPSADQHRDHVHVEIVPAPPIGLTPVVRRGVRSEDVKFVQRAVGAKVDGQFGPQTEAKVKLWQAWNSLPVDGVIDDDDWVVLFRGK